MSIEGTANTEYASLSGKIRTFVVDKTLSVSGACADAKATGDKLNSLIDDAETAAVEAATKTANEKLANFLDGTMTDPDKAAQAAAVGAAFDAVVVRLDELDAQYTIEKIVEVNITEVTYSFYIELPKTLSNYPVFIFHATGTRYPANVSVGHGASVFTVESLTSTTALYNVCNLAPQINPPKPSTGVCQVFYIVSEDNGTVWISGNATTDTKYLYVNAVDGLAAGAHFEMWGAAQ